MTARDRHSDNPTFLLLKALITGQKIYFATSDGNANKKTVVCTDFSSIADQDGNQIHIVDPNSDAEDQTRDITGDTTSGTITVLTAFDAQIMEDTAFIISGIRSTPVEVAALQADVDEIPSEANSKTFNATALAAIQSEVEKAIEDGGQVMVITTIATLASQTSFTLTVGSADDDAYNGMIAVVEDVTTAAQKAIGVISNYVGSSKTITLREDPGIFTMAATDKISIKSISPDILNILADTNELQTDWANGGRLDSILDNVLLDTQLKFAVSGTHAFTTGLENFLNIDSGTDGAEIVSITLKGIVGADWTIEGYIPVVDAVAAPAVGDKRFEEIYISGDTEGGQLTRIGAIRYNMFLDITNDSAGSDNVDEVIIAYRSRGTLTAVWEGA